MRSIPTGIQDFKEIRDGNFYYVDKTEFIAQILDNPAKAFLFTRPRRFGKSLNLSMLDAFLNIKYKDNTWFDDLKISERKDLQIHKNAYPVINFDFKDLDTSSYDSFVNDVAIRVSEIYDKHSTFFDNASPRIKSVFEQIIQKTSDAGTLRRSLLYLTEVMSAHCGKKVIVLIDEYDNPIHNAYGSETLRQILDFMKIMLGSLLKGNESLNFAVVTGVMQISKESIFSGLNNLRVNNIFSKDSDEMFGFTHEEVKQMCSDFGHHEKFEEAKEWYDGYTFGNAEVYNPWSLLMYAVEDFQPAAYWAGTSGNSIINDLLNRTDEYTADNLRILASGGSICQNINPAITYSDFDSNLSSIYSVMAMSGYLRVSLNDGIQHLSIPNKEMFSVFADMISNYMFMDSGLLGQFINAVMKCNTDAMSKMLYSVSEYVGFRAFDSERSYQMLITGILMTSPQHTTTAEMEAGNGFYDIRMESKVRSLPNAIIEIKRRRDSNSKKSSKELSEDAIEQIKTKDYCRGLKGDTILYGICFDGKKPTISFECITL